MKPSCCLLDPDRLKIMQVSLIAGPDTSTGRGSFAFWWFGKETLQFDKAEKN